MRMSPYRPFISIIMGVYRQQEDLTALERAIGSILSQTYTEFEFLICESGSTSSTKECLNRFSQEDSRIRLIDGARANTLAAKLNRCLLAAKGELVARMDDDDYSCPERLEKQAAFLREHPGCAVVGSWIREVGGLKESVRELPPQPQIRDFRKTLPYVHPALMFRKDVLFSIGLYSENIRQVGCDDYDLLMRLYAKGYRGANLQEVLLEYSIVSSQLCRRPYHLFINEFNTRRACFQMLGLLPNWWIWAIKPLIAGLIPRRILYYIKYWVRRGRRRGEILD